MNILVTGGAGYIGSHVVVELINSGHNPIIVDNFSNSSNVVMQRLEEITGKTITHYNLDLQDKTALNEIFEKEALEGVIHLAGLKAVGESVKKPLTYYRVNLDSTLSLLETMEAYNVNLFVFSSSATVYGSAPVPYKETHAVGQGVTSPYGQTKYMIEQILRDVAIARPEASITLLRYFNPVGAHESGKIGEDPVGVPNNLVPFIAQVATRKRESLSVFGNDYDTPDGTCVRDYIHVVDIAKGHVAALEHSKPGAVAYNLGSGKGTTVLEVIRAFEKASGKDIPYTIEPRREGDLPAFYADVTLAASELNWKTTKTIDDMCVDTWRWQSQNPNGYAS